MKLDKYKIDVEDYKATVMKVDDKKYDIKYVIEVDDFPGVVGGGYTFEEALKEVTEALQTFLEVKDAK